jgi:hypothetical protein
MEFGVLAQAVRNHHQVLTAEEDLLQVKEILEEQIQIQPQHHTQELVEAEQEQRDKQLQVVQHLDQVEQVGTCLLFMEPLTV